MRCNVKRGRLITVSANRRTRQFPLPRIAYVIVAVVFVALWYLLWHPVVKSLLVHGVTHAQPRSVAEAASVVYREVASDIENTFAAQRPAQDSQLTTYKLTLPNNTLSNMQQSLKLGDRHLNHEDGGNKPYFKASLVVDDEPPQEVKICLRGSMFWHHLPAKPSLRIKIKKDALRGGDRYVELTTLEDALGVINWLPMQLAEWLGLMTDDPEHVRLFVNEKYFGVYVRSMRQGEPFALANGRMPGTFFKGDFVRRMWESSTDWKISGEQHPADIDVFDKWLKNLQQPVTPATLHRNAEMLDTEVFACWAALMAVAGSIHTDDRHNHSYFFCSNQGKLHAMPWDVNGCGVHITPDCPIDVQIQPVLRLLNHDPRWVHRRNQWIHNLITGPASAAKLTQQIEKHWQRIGRDLQADRNLGRLVKSEGAGWHRVPVSVMELDEHKFRFINWIERRDRYLRDYISKALVAARPVASNADWSEVIVYGNAALKVSDGGRSETSVTGTLYPGLSDQEYESDQPQSPISISYLKPAALKYKVPIPFEHLAFVNAIDDTKVRMQPWTDELDHFPARTIHPDRFSQEPRREITLGPGCVNVEQDILVGRYQSLVIRAGTDLRIAPNVGIYSRGKTIAIGTLDRPILISGSADQPWAAIGIAGPQTAGSRFEHVHVRGGSIGRLGELRFKGMFNVYDCTDLVMKHCRFGKNHIGDDSVNLAESNIVVENCQWTDARADGLDLDMCRGVIRNCDFSKCGNDGVDLMASNVEMTGCQIARSGDKGISIGENSRLHARNNQISECAIGIEFKDDSVAQFENGTFDRCQTAVHAYQKKWFYKSGGTAALVDCNFIDNNCDVDIEKKSRLLLIRSPINPVQSAISKRIEQLVELPSRWVTPIEAETCKEDSN